MRIKNTKPTSFEIRLRELMRERKMTQKDLAKQLHHPVGSAYHDQDKFIGDGSISTQAIRDWFKKESLPKEEWLIQLAEIFDVDMDYLKGLQVERKKTEFSIDDGKELAEAVQELELTEKLLKELGYTVSYLPTGTSYDTFEVLEGNNVVTYQINTPIRHKLKLEREGRSHTFSEQEQEDIKQAVIDFLRFKIESCMTNEATEDRGDK